MYRLQLGIRRVKGSTSRKIQQEFSHLKRRYWGMRFWARGYFCTTSGNVTNEVMAILLKNLPATAGSGLVKRAIIFVIFFPFIL
jgi:hypothetical protein